MANNIERQLIDSSNEDYQMLNGRELEDLIKSIQDYVEQYNYKYSPYKHVICHFAGESCTLLVSLICDINTVTETIDIAETFMKDFVKSLKDNYKEIFDKKIKFDSKEDYMTYVEKLDLNNRHSVIVSKRFMLV